MRKIIVILLFVFYKTFINGVLAAPVNDFDAGTWTDGYVDGNYLNNKSQADVDTGVGQIKLKKNTGVGFSPPYFTTGSVKTNDIGGDLGVKIARWSTVSFVGTTPVNTTIKIQVLDAAGNVYPNTMLAGNESGFTSSPIDISALPMERNVLPYTAKAPRIRLKIELNTGDTSVTPTIDSITVAWLTTTGDLSATTLANTAWPIENGNNQNTRSVGFTASDVYQVLRWTKDQPNDYGGGIVRGDGEILYNKTAGGSSNNGSLSAINRNNGETIWTRQQSGQYYSDSRLTVGQNGTLYLTGQENDIMAAYDVGNSGLPKWIYQFNNGHGNNQVVIGSDGTLFTPRFDFYNYAYMYAFNPDGSVKWTTNLTPSGSDTISSSQVALTLSGLVVVSFNRYDVHQAIVYALDPTDGSIEWQYDEGVASNELLIDTNDDIYIADSFYSDNPIDRKIIALHNDGSLKWQKVYTNTYDFFTTLGLRPDGNIVAIRGNYNVNTETVEVLSADDGSTIWSDTIDATTSQSGNGNMIIDGRSGVILNSQVGDSNPHLYYLDINGDEKWSYQKQNTIGGIDIFSQMTPDEDGRYYLNLTNYYVTDSNTILAFYPWTINMVSDRNVVGTGQTINFTVTTSMPQVDPLTSENNQIQIYMDTGNTIPLSFSSTDGAGNTIWIGTYTVSGSLSEGNHTFTAEANSTGVRTDTSVHFNTPATYSENTGITTTKTIEVNNTTENYVFNNGDVVINKIYPLGSEEWIELYNTTNRAINLTNWMVGITNPDHETYVISTGIIPKNGLFTINLPVSTDTLDDTSGTMIIKTPTNDIINTVTYGSGSIPSAVVDQTVYRYSIGSTGWGVGSTAPKGWFTINDAPAASTIDAGLGSSGVETNFGELVDLTRASDLYFEKTGFGRIQFASTLNLTDSDVVTWLQNLGSKLDLSTQNRIGLDADTVRDLISTQATLTMYNVTLTNPKILVDNAEDTDNVVSNLVYDRTAHTLTFTAAHFTTFEAVENNSDSTPSSSSPLLNQVPSCGDLKPLFIPDLFQINTTKTTAKLFFTPLPDTNQYYISFSTKPSALEHGTLETLSREGVQNFTVNLLKPNTTYYFKVRGQSGCQPGEWSNIMKIKTNNQKYYKKVLK